MQKKTRIYLGFILGGIISILSFVGFMNDPRITPDERPLQASMMAVLGFLFGMLIVLMLTRKKRIQTTSGYASTNNYSMGRSFQRRHFSDDVKERTLRRQNHRCNSCNRLLNVVDYDHVDGDRSNNDTSNCQALCPNCHAEKTRRERMDKEF